MMEFYSDFDKQMWDVLSWRRATACHRRSLLILNKEKENGHRTRS